jgi:D-alanine-D-alanine ligase
MRVAVLRGGPSNKYDSSLETGEYVLSLLRQMPEKFQPVDIFISKEGDWHVSGIKKKPAEALKHVDVVFNALHGAYGEDGQVQKILSALRIPYTGSKAFGSALSASRDMAKEAYVLADLLTPRHTLLYGNVSIDNLIHVFRTYVPPMIVKPAKDNIHSHKSLAHTFEELKEKVAEALNYSDKVLVEEYIKGKEAVCGVIENIRGEKLYSLLPQPNTFSVSQHKRMGEMAKTAHLALGLRHYSSSSFIITPKGKIYIVETNALPSLSKNNSFTKSLSAVGMKSKELVEHLINLAQTK